MKRYVAEQPAGANVQSRLNSPGRWARGYYKFFMLQLFHITLFAVLSTDEPSGVLLIASGAINFAVYGSLLWNDLRTGGDEINPFWFYLGMSALRLGPGTCFVGLTLISGDLWVVQLGQLDPYNWLMKGHLLLLVGDYFFVGGYFLYRRRWNRKARKLIGQCDARWANVYKAGLALAVIGFATRFLEAYLFFGSFGQIVSYVADYGVPAGIFMMLDSCRRRTSKRNRSAYALPVVLLCVAIVSGFSTYMKTDLLISLFPLLLLGVDSITGKYGANTWKTRIKAKHLLMLGVALYFFAFTLTSYSDLRRKGYWENMSPGQLRPTAEFAPAVWPDLQTALKGSVPGTAEFDELHSYPTGGAWQLLARLSVTTWAATAVGLVEQYGTNDRSMIAEIGWSVVPRIIYPEKPQISRGRETAVELGQARSVEEATSATSLSMFGYAFRSGGALNVLFMATLSGAAFAFVFSRFIGDWRNNPISMLVVMVLIYNGLHWKESDALAGIPFYIYTLVVFLPMAYLWRRASTGRRIAAL